jgi:alpha-1,6-mannosyltransferase
MIFPLQWRPDNSVMVKEDRHSLRKVKREKSRLLERVSTCIRLRESRDLALHFVRRNWAIITCGTMLEAGFAVFLYLTDVNNWTVLPGLFFVLFLLYVSSLWVRKQTHAGGDVFALILAFAVVFRLTLLFSGPVFSFDFYRYIWDGKVGANGINPYLYPPDSTRLSSLRDANWELVNHRYVRTSYPPLAEMLFEMLYLAFRIATSYKMTFFVFDLATIAVIWLMLRELKLEQSNVMIYAWAPLPVIEIAQTGHYDSVSVLLVLLSFLLLLRKQNTSSAAVMALAVLAKLYPIFFAPVLLRRWGKKGTIVFLGLILAFYAPYAGIGLEIFRGLLFPINTANFNASIFPLAVALLQSTDTVSNPGFSTQIVLYVAYFSLLLVAVMKSMREDSAVELMKICFLLSGTLLLLNRAFFPWYMIWMIPFLAFYSSASWLLLTGTIFLGYLNYNSFPPPPYQALDPQTAMLVSLVEYVPFYALFGYELLKRRFPLVAQ